MEVETSTFADDWYKTLQEPRFHDVTFVVEGDRQLNAHKTVLCSASKFFAKVLGVSEGTRVRFCVCVYPKNKCKLSVRACIQDSQVCHVLAVFPVDDDGRATECDTLPLNGS